MQIIILVVCIMVLKYKNNTDVRRVTFFKITKAAGNQSYQFACSVFINSITLSFNFS